MTGEALRALRLACLDRTTGKAPTQVTAAALLGVDPNTLARYERDEIAIPKPVALLARRVLLGELDIGSHEPDLDDG